MRSTILLFALTVIATGCGIKGGLYVPPPPSVPAATQSSPTNASAFAKEKNAQSAPASTSTPTTK